MLSTHAAHRSTRQQASRGDVHVHDHLCGLYDTREDQYAPASRFLQLGLERKEQCLYITEHQTPAAFLAILATHGVDVAEAIASGSLEVVSGTEMHVTLGGFTPDAMFSLLTEREKKAHRGGFTAFRWGAEMTWLSQHQVAPADLFTFEARLNSFLPEHQLTGFCQYAMSDFGAELLIAAAETHPLLVYNAVVCNNYYYIPPEEYLKPAFPDLKLKRMLFNMITRERLMERFLESSDD